MSDARRAKTSKASKTSKTSKSPDLKGDEGKMITHADDAAAAPPTVPVAVATTPR